MKIRNITVALALILALTLPVLSLAEDGFGAAAVKEGEHYTVEQMLTYAIQDEYLAQAEYKAIIQAFGAGRPFTNIVKAEAVHVERLLPLFAANNIPVPPDTADSHVVLPASLQEIYAIGVEAEIHNIAMYEAFLAQEDLPGDVRAVFLALKNASENHLAAFQRNMDKAAGSGNTQGRNGRGRKGN